MTRWKVEFRPSADKQLRKLPREVQAAIITALERLVLEQSNPEEPRASNLKKLAGRGEEWRMRVGDYRVIFERQGDRLVILVLNLGHRREVYRD